MEGILWYWLVIQLVYWIFIFIGIYRFDRLRSKLDFAGQAPPVTFDMIIPAFNERRHLKMIAANLERARAGHFSAFVVDDGSRDGSTDCLAVLCHDAKAQLLRHAKNCGKAAALQTGLGAVTAPFALLVDADTSAQLLECNVRIDPSIAAVAFTIAAIESGHLAAAQAREYEYILNFEREAFAGFGVVLTVPGSASLWRTQSLDEIGGFSSRTEAADSDATIV